MSNQSSHWKRSTCISLALSLQTACTEKAYCAASDAEQLSAELKEIYPVDSISVSPLL